MNGGGMSTYTDVESQFPNSQEQEYSYWWNKERMLRYLRTAHMGTKWNCIICVLVLAGVVWVVIEEPIVDGLDLGYNIVYGIHVASIVYSTVITLDSYNFSLASTVRLVLDFASFLHYAMTIGSPKNFKIFCYYLRFNRPFKYIWLTDYNLKGSILGTALKFCYLFFVLKITWALLWVFIDELEADNIDNTTIHSRRALYQFQLEQNGGEQSISAATHFLSALYIVNKMFIPIGPSVAPANDTERLTCLLVMLTGCLMLTGVAVASLSLVISIYMQPEESFRERYRLIMKEMKDSKVPPSLREKVETFYKMYWHKLKAVSATQLLPTYPPTLPNTIYTDIYFAATQKNQILRDLSYEFLSKMAKKMNTVLYIPGDEIIKRSSKKSTIIFIAYGDVEMLSAEDDITPVLRMTRGTLLAGRAGGVTAACARAHVRIRAATFCIAHVLSTRDLWLVALKHESYHGQTNIILSSFDEHLERVKRHYFLKVPEEAKYKSSIYHFKRKLMALIEAKDEQGKLLLARRDVFLEIAGSYIMRNRADASQANEADAICLRSTFPCILQPSSSLQLAWQLFISCIITTVCFTHPYYLVYKKYVPVEFRFFDYVVTVLFVLDLIALLSTGANVEEGVPITFTQTSSQQMRSRWFVLDVVGTLPIFEFISNGHFAGINKLLRLPKVFRTLKTLEEIYVYHSNILRYLYYTLVLLMACYLIAALQQGFMCHQFRYCLVTNFTHTPYWENKTLDEETVNNRLVFGLYWAISMITLTSHMESWKTENWNLTIYTLCVLEICVVLRIFIEAVYSATIMVTTALREDYDSCIANVKDFLVRNAVDPQLRQRFITYLQLCWYTDKAYSMTNKKSSIFHDLPPHVYQDIVVRQRSKYLLSIPFMKFLNDEDLKTVSTNAKLFYTSPNEILLNTGDISNEMYVIKQGICEILDPDTKQVVGTLGIKNHFGVIECLLRLPAYYTVRAVTHVQVFTISNKVLSRAMDLPQIKDAMEFAKERPEYSRLLNARESFQKYVPPAPPPNTERFRKPRKYETDFAFLQPFNRLGFFSILRYIFPRFTIRPDGRYLARYEWVRLTCTLLSAAVYPGYAYLEMQWPGLYYLAFLLDISAYFDILQRMLVGYFNAEGALVFHPVSTAAHYLRGAFIIDLFACLPLENLESLTLETIENIPRTASRQILMLNRLLQLYRLPSAMLALHGYIERRDIVLVLKAIPLFLVLLNTLTSLMVFCSVYISVPQNGKWLILPFRDEGGSWLNLFSDTFRFNMTESPWNLHLTTFFWVVYETTTTGYGCFNPSNLKLMAVLFIGMVVSSTFITYVSVRIISVRATVNKELAAYQEHMKDIVGFMRRESLPDRLQGEVLSYYEYNWEKTGGIDYTSVLKLCDQITLRTDAILHIYGTTFEKCPFLEGRDVSLLRIIGRAVRSVYCLRDMVLVEANDVIEDLYFLDDGVVTIKDVWDTSSKIAILGKGSVFGNLENAHTVRYPSTVVAQSMVHVLRIKAATFHRIIGDFPQVAKEFAKLRLEHEDFIMGRADDYPIRGKHKTNSLTLFDRSNRFCHLFLKNKFLQTYIMVISLACVYADVYNAGFQHNTMALIAFLYALDFCFYLKILIHAFPYMALSVNLKKTLIPVRETYMKYEFKYDLVSCLPLELTSLAFDDHRWMIFSCLRLNRMFRVVAAHNCLMRNREQTVNLVLNTVVSVLIWFTLFIHTTACFWYFIAVLEDNSLPESSWIYKDDGDSWCHNLYICSVYFVLTTFTQNGVGDIIPKNQSEVIFVSVLQIVSTMLYMIYVGEFSNIIQFRSFRTIRFYCKYLELQEFLKNNRVSKNLVAVVNRYSLHLWREARGMQLPHLVRVAPRALRLRLMAAAFGHHLMTNPVFMNCEPAFLRQLVGCLQLYTYDKGLYVVRKTEITNSMYMIHAGRVKEIHSHPERNRFYTAASCFGMEQGLLYDVPYPYSYLTVTKAQVLTLRHGDWENLLYHFPKSKKTIYKYFEGGNDDSPNELRDQTMIVEDDNKNDSTKLTSETYDKPDDIIVQLEQNVPQPDSNLTDSKAGKVSVTPVITSPIIDVPLIESDVISSSSASSRVVHNLENRSHAAISLKIKENQRSERNDADTSLLPSNRTNVVPDTAPSLKEEQIQPNQSGVSINAPIESMAITFKPSKEIAINRSAELTKVISSTAVTEPLTEIETMIITEIPYNDTEENVVSSIRHEEDTQILPPMNIEELPVTPNDTNSPVSPISDTKLFFSQSDVRRRESNVKDNLETGSKSETKYSYVKGNKDIDEAEPNVNESSRSDISLPPIKSRPRSTTLKKIESKVRQFFRHSFESRRSKSDATIDKDNLQMEEDEANTTALVRQFARKSKLSIKQTFNTKNTVKESAAPGSSKKLTISDTEPVSNSDQIKSRQKQSVVTIKETTENDNYALVPFKEVGRIHDENLSELSHKTLTERTGTRSEPSLQIHEIDDVSEAEVTRPENQAGPSTGRTLKKEKKKRRSTR